MNPTDTNTLSPTTECGARRELLTTPTAPARIPTEIGTLLSEPPESPETLAPTSTQDLTPSPSLVLRLLPRRSCLCATKSRDTFPSTPSLSCGSLLGLTLRSFLMTTRT